MSDNPSNGHDPNLARDQLPNRRKLTVTREEAEASQGTIDIRQNPDDSITFTMPDDSAGTVAGWMFVKIQQLEAKVHSDAGLLHAAGLRVQQLEQANQQRTPGGLVLP